MSQNRDDLTTAQAQIDLLTQDEATATRLWQEAEKNHRQKEIYLNQLAHDFQTLLAGYWKLETTTKEKIRLLQNKTQTLRAEKKELKKQNKELQDQLNNRPAPQPKQPEGINKKSFFIGAASGASLAIAGRLAYNYYNLGYSSTSQLNILDNSANNSLNLNYPNPFWENVPNN